MILWGPPGTGKTTLARLMAGAFDAEFIVLSAVLAGVKDIREAVERAQVARDRGRRPSSSSTRCTASTRRSRTPSCRTSSRACSPSSARRPRTLRSKSTRRCCRARRCYVLKPLDRRRPAATLLDARRQRCTRRALEPRRARAPARLRRRRCAPAAQRAREPASPPAAAKRAEITTSGCSRRARRAHAPLRQGRRAVLRHDLARCTSRCAAPTPTPSLYWFVRMLDGGADPRYMARRMVRMASEDIGLADPRALRVALDAAEAYERLGSPEGELALAEAWSTSPWRRSRTRSTTPTTRPARSSKQDGTRPVPLHLRNAPTQLMKDLDYGARLPLRARRGGRFRRRRELLARGRRRRSSTAGGAGPRDPHRREAARAARAQRRSEAPAKRLPGAQPG